MLSRSTFIAGCITVAAMLLSPGSAVPAPQQVGFDRDASARDYVQFLVSEIDQWTKDFPRRFYAAVVKPPVDESKLSADMKASPDELGNAVKQLLSLSSANDLLANAAFRDELGKALASAKVLNQAMASQRFPEPLQNDWTQIRATLNNLAGIYKLETLAYLDPPGGGGGRGRGGRGAQQAAAAPPPPPPGAGLVGYIVDQSCSLKGKGMWTNAQCVARCIRDGDKVVLVTEEGKVFQIANPDKIESDTYGQKVTLLGKVDGETITVASVQI
jgi:hypothetical protein